MKKLFAILLVFTMLFTVCACGNQATPGNNTTNTPGTSSGTNTNTNTNNGGGNTSNSSEPILIGLLDAFSGEKASNGEYTKEGAELFLKEINAKGGVLGRPVKIIYEDDQGNETVATNAYQKLVSQNDVCATVLNKYSSVVLAMSDFVEEAEIPAICSGSSTNIEKSTNPYLYSTRRSDSGSGVTLAAQCNKLGVKKVAIIHSPDALGTGMTPIVEKALAEYGIQVVSNQQYTADEKNFAPYIAKIIDSGCDCIVGIGQINEAVLIMKAVADAGLNVPCVASSAFAQSSCIENAGAAAEDWYSITAFSPYAKDEKTAAWIKKYNDKYGRLPEMTSATTYDALSMICWAIEQAGSTDPEAINNALKSIKSFEGIASIYTFQGTPMLATSEFIVQVKNGSTEVLDKLSVE